MQNQETDQLEIYKNLLLQAAKYHQPPREKTFFDTAIRKHYENPTTELLSFFLNPENEHGLGSVFFDGLTDAINTFNPIAEADDYGSVKKVVTELAVLEITPKGFKLLERAPGVSVEDIIKATEADLIIEGEILEMKID